MQHTEPALSARWRRGVRLLFVTVLSLQGCATAAPSQPQSTHHSPQSAKKPASVIVIDERLDTKNTPVLAAWLFYAGARAMWIDGKFVEAFPDRGVYRYSFSEELYARRYLVKFWLTLKQKTPVPVDRYLDELADVDRAGFLKEYVWEHFFSDQWFETSEGFRVEAFTQWENEKFPGHMAQTRVIAKPKDPERSNPTLNQTGR